METPSLPPPPVPSARVRVDIAADSHPGAVRETNEDAYVVLRRAMSLEPVGTNVPEVERYRLPGGVSHIMIVADGLGGHAAGEVASRTALLTTLDYIFQSPKWRYELDDPEKREGEIAGVSVEAQRYLTMVHDALREKAASDPELAGMGTTLTGIMTSGLDAFVVHVGDSRAYLQRGSSLTRITHDHTVAQGYADLGVIPQEEVPRHRMHHVLTRAVGGPEDSLQGDFVHLTLEDGDRLLLCSDGLTDTVTESEITHVLAGSSSSRQACRGLMDMALTRGARDNVTLIVAGYIVV